MFTDDNYNYQEEKKQRVQVFKIKGIKNFVVIKSQQDDYYLTSALIPWYGFYYNLLLSINTRYGMKLDKKKLNELQLEEETISTNTRDAFIILGYVLLIVPFKLIQNYVFLNIGWYGYLVAWILAISIGMGFRFISIKGDKKKSSVVGEFRVDHILKIKSNSKRMIWILGVFIASVGIYNTGIPTIIYSIPLYFDRFYGSIGDMKTKRLILPNTLGSLYNITKIGEIEKIEFEPPLLVSVEEKR